MSELSLKVIDKSGKTRFVASGDNEVVLVNTSEYQEGDRISLETGTVDGESNRRLKGCGL